MKILCIIHAQFETPGIITDWATARGHELIVAKPFAGDRLGLFPETDFLIVMGGPQSVLDVERIPYLKEEISRIQQALSRGNPVLGFCLGSQLIGEALGAKGERSPEKEVGVYPITLTQEGSKDPMFRGVPPSFEVIHWHNDMPGLTKDSVVLAKSAGCPRQIVKYKSNVYGFQCHLEIKREQIEVMAKACPDDFKPSKFTQNLGDFLKKDFESIHHRLIEFLDRLVTDLS